MLEELYIEHFAIIEQLSLRFHPGLNVITGETGAGKSIIIDAVNAVLGARAAPEWIRAGSPRALVEATFTLPPPLAAEIDRVLAAEGLEGETGTLLLSRELRRTGRNIARVNGRAVALDIVRHLGQALLDIHGQGDHVTLLRAKEHINLLDHFAGLETERAQMRQWVRQIEAIRRQRQLWQQEARQRAQNIDLLTYQINEIRSAYLQDGEEETLLLERQRLAHAEQILAGLQSSRAALTGEGEAQPGAEDLLGETVHQLSRLSDLDPELANLAEQAELLAEQVHDLNASLLRYAEQIEYNPERLGEVEERLTLLHNLKRKYGDSIAEIIAFGTAAAAKLETLQNVDAEIDHLQAEEEALLAKIGQLAGEMSQRRREAGEQLAAKVEEELAALRMADTQFAVRIERQEAANGAPADTKRYAFNETGFDKVTFMVAVNPGEPLYPLTRVASGGETARLMLALKTVLSHADAIPTLIFDEIDVGIGGRVGSIVGQKLWRIARDHQVLCVTHLPQLAAFGDTHWRAQKIERDGRTITAVSQLDGEERLAEIAAMLGSISQAGLDSAREMLTAAQTWKGKSADKR